MKLDFENLASYSTEELEEVQRSLAQELRRRIKEKRELEELEKLAAKYGYTLTKGTSVIREIVGLTEKGEKSRS